MYYTNKKGFKKKLKLKTKKENGKLLIETILFKNKCLNDMNSDLVDKIFDLTGKEIKNLKPLFGSNKIKKYTLLSKDFDIEYKRKKKHSLKLKGSIEHLAMFIDSLVEKTFEEDIYDMLIDLVSHKTGRSKKELSSVIVFNQELKDTLSKVETISVNEDIIDSGVMTIDFIDFKKPLSERNNSSKIIITQSLSDFISNETPLTNKEILERIKNYHNKKNLMLKSFNKKQKDSILAEK